jgi:hypothetical protein
MLERGKPIVMAMGEGVGDSSTTRCCTIKAQKDAEQKRGNEGPYISLSLDPCHQNGCYFHLSLCTGIFESWAPPVMWRFSDLSALELYVL